MALKHTQVELDLITDKDAYLMIKNFIRGGIATISKKYVKANNFLVEGYDPSKQTTYIIYSDANNLYGNAQSEPLPVGDFKFLTDEEIEHLDLTTVADDSPTGYIVECDLEYPEKLHDLHSDYPLARDHLKLTSKMVSPFVRNLQGDGWKPAEKLIPNLQNKNIYVTHYRNLKLYVKQSLKMTKIHKILSFIQRPWLKYWIDLCTKQRKNARSDFEADLAKLQANATFGKTMEQVKNRVNIRLRADPAKLCKAVSKPSYKFSQIINPDLVMVQRGRQKVCLNKPISMGFCILDLTKLIMYKFYYETLKPKYGDRLKLLFTDTDHVGTRQT